MQNLILSLEGQFPQIYSQSKLLNSGNNLNVNNPNSTQSSHFTSHSSQPSPHSSSTSSVSTSVPSVTSTVSSTNSDEILPNKLPLKRRLSEFRYGRDGGTLTVGKKGSSTSGKIS